MRIQPIQDLSMAQYVYERLIAFNAANMPQGIPKRYEKVEFCLLDEEGTIKGGVLGYLTWNWLHIDILWVADECRGQGYGSQLLYLMENVAQQAGCECIDLDTYSFQAPEFYKKHGFEECGSIAFSGGKVHRYYLVKRL